MLAETSANTHRASRGCDGVRRVQAELVKGLSITVGGRVGLVMARISLRGLAGTREQSVSRKHRITAADLVNRYFTADALNQLWCT